MLSNKYKKAVIGCIDPWVQKGAGGKISPNYITLLGVFGAAAAGFYYAWGKLTIAGILLGFSGLCDLLDGSLARAANKSTLFGAFLDSTLDRYADMAVFLGLSWHYAHLGKIYTLLAAFLALVGSVMVSYTRARAENLIASCQVGWFERPERIILLLFGSFLPIMPLILWTLAIGANVTALQRIYHTYKRTKVEYGG